MDQNYNPLHEHVPPTWNGIFIHPNEPDERPPSTLDDIRPHVDNCLLRITDDGQVSQQDFRDLLLSDTAIVVANIYNRDPAQFDWYYTLYGIPRDRQHHMPINSVASIALKAHEDLIRGPVLVVKNGPASGLWDLDETISDDEFARTLCWYLLGGHSVEAVFGSRTLCRLLADAPE